LAGVDERAGVDEGAVCGGAVGGFVEGSGEGLGGGQDDVASFGEDTSGIADGNRLGGRRGGAHLALGGQVAGERKLRERKGAEEAASDVEDSLGSAFYALDRVGELALDDGGGVGGADEQREGELVTHVGGWSAWNS
jgi:hypothetical protein